MTSDSSTAPPAPASTPRRWLLDLLFRPRAFFRTYALTPVPAFTALAFYIFGVGNAIDHLDYRLTTAELRGRERSSLTALAEHWLSYWPGVAVAGIMSALLLSSIGTWWYRKRLQLSGGVRPDPRLAARVYAFASLVWAIPTLLYTVWATIEYASPRAAMSGDDRGEFVVLAFAFWSLFTSHRGVTTAFALRPFAARMWFLILPGLFYAAVFGALSAAALMPPAWFAPTPDVHHWVGKETATFRLRYPGNWRIDAHIPDYDADTFFAIDPPTADALCLFHVGIAGEDFDSAADAVAAYQADEAFAADAWQPVDHWGAVSGVGQRAFGPDYTTLLFACQRESSIVLVRESCANDLRPKMERGFELIRQSFAWK